MKDWLKTAADCMALVGLEVVIVPPLPGQAFAKSVTLEDGRHQDGQADEDDAQGVDDDALVGELGVEVANTVHHRLSVQSLGRMANGKEAKHNLLSVAKCAD